MSCSKTGRVPRASQPPLLGQLHGASKWPKLEPGPWTTAPGQAHSRLHRKPRPLPAHAWAAFPELPLPLSGCPSLWDQEGKTPGHQNQAIKITPINSELSKLVVIGAIELDWLGHISGKI